MSKASERHMMLSANMANANTPGYKRKDVDFNIVLKRADTKLNMSERYRLNAKPFVNGLANSSLRADGNSVDMEQEVVAMAETELRYQAVSGFAGDYFKGLKNVIREGR